MRRGRSCVIAGDRARVTSSFGAPLELIPFRRARVATPSSSQRPPSSSSTSGPKSPPELSTSGCATTARAPAASSSPRHRRDRYLVRQPERRSALPIFQVVSRRYEQEDHRHHHQPGLRRVAGDLPQRPLHHRPYRPASSTTPGSLASRVRATAGARPRSSRSSRFSPRSDLALCLTLGDAKGTQSRSQCKPPNSAGADDDGLRDGGLSATFTSQASRQGRRPREPAPGRPGLSPRGARRS